MENPPVRLGIVGLGNWSRQVFQAVGEARTIAGNPAAVPVEVENLLILSKALAKTSLERKESRGGFYREDYPASAKDAPEAHILALSEAGEVALRKEILDPQWNPNFQNRLDKERWG